MRCIAKRQDGKQCLVDFGVEDDGLCWHHSAKHIEARRRAKSQGGKSTATMRRKFNQKTITEEEALSPPLTAADCVAWSSWTAWAVSTGRIDKSTAREISYSLRTLLNALEKAEIEQAIIELKAQVAELKGKP